MQQVPPFVLRVALASQVPLVWGALTVLVPGFADWSLRFLGPRFVGPYIQLYFGALLLAFMSGVLWGFASRETGARAHTAYLLATLPALWAFFFTGGGPIRAGTFLVIGYLGLLVLDYQFWSWRLAPSWWMQLRVPITVVTLLCLAVGIVL